MCDRSLFLNGLDRMGIDLDEEALERILLYCRHLLKWKNKVNLVARNTPADEILEKHFLDSLSLLGIIHQAPVPSPSLLDVGTGAGFPGLVLAAARPSLSVTLVEPRQKRVIFLQHVVRSLELANVQLYADRLENVDGLERQAYTYITSRALADVDRFLSMIDPVAGPGTRVILMQAEEKRDGSRAASWNGKWMPVETIRFKLPFSGAPRLLTVVRRRAGAPEKQGEP